jgi:hypothetical protein
VTPWFRAPDGPTLRVVLGWCLIIDALFFTIYGGVNWLTRQRTDLLDLYHPWELAIPLVPVAIWVYASLFLLFCLPLFTLPKERARGEAMGAILGLFASAAIWLLLPARLGFERVLPPGYEAWYGAMFALDAPHNLVPSLHVVFSCLAVLACGQGAPALVRLGLWAWLGAIAAATVLTHQHHLLDVAVAVPLAFACRARALRWSARADVLFVPTMLRENRR